MSGHLCLKWNNHSSAFLKSINHIHTKERYCDATLACQGKFFPVHRFVLSTCSDYFDEIFDRMQCPHPYIVFKDIDPREMELLLNYMYEGEVNVVQERLPTLIKAAEALHIKGLAVPDDMPGAKEGSTGSRKRSSTSSDASQPKRRMEERRRRRTSSDFNARSEVANTSSVDAGQSSHRDNELREIKQEPVDIIVDDFNAGEAPPTIKTEFDAGETIAGNSESGTKDEGGVFCSFPLAQEDSFSKTDEDLPTDGQFEDNQSSSWGDYPASGSMMQGLPSDDIGLQEDMFGVTAVERVRHPNIHLSDWTEPESRGNVTRTDLEERRGSSSQTAPPRIHRCRLCSYKSNNSYNLKRHIMFKHTGEKPFSCSICSRRFTEKKALRVHTRTHTGEKPYQCSICSRKFTHNISLKMHTCNKFGYATMSH